MRSSHWSALVIFDGAAVPMISDPRIGFHVMRENGRGTRNFAGDLMNQGAYLSTSDWIGWVDDDDTVGPDYVDQLEKEIRGCSHVNVVIFRFAQVEGGKRGMSFLLTSIVCRWRGNTFKFAQNDHRYGRIMWELVLLSDGRCFFLVLSLCQDLQRPLISSGVSRQQGARL